MSRYGLIILKRKLEDLVIAPFVWLGRKKARRYPLGENYDIFFFFPFYHMGGAERVHANVARAFRDRKAIIFFTRKSHNDHFKKIFESCGHRILDISSETDNKWQYWKNLVCRGKISAYINSQPSPPIVFNGQSNFGYKISPWILEEIPQIELIHSLNTFSYIRIPFLPFYSKTVMISRKRIDDHFSLYERYGIPFTFREKIEYIPNGIEIHSPTTGKKQEDPPLKLLYSGRATPEKRAWLVSQIADAAIHEGLNIRLTMLGPNKEDIKEPMEEEIQFPGMIKEERELTEWYRQSDVLLITSSEEGFPMVVMEAMSQGCIIIATPVGDLPIHIKQGENGFLFSSISDESIIIMEAVGWLGKLVQSPALRQKITENNIAYAKQNFGLAKFEQAYRQLFETVKLSH